MGTENSATDWCIPCLADNEEQEPSPEELDLLYQQIETKEILELSWKCPGRRLPTPIGKNNVEADETQENENSSKNLEFDFMDDISTPKMRVRSQNTAPKGSAKKKTASFASVLNAMKKNKQNTPQKN